MHLDLRHYFVVTLGYWAFTLTDGAIRMLVVLYFHLLGYSPFEVAMLFLFYEFFGIVTNLVGGWLASRIGLNLTMHMGMGMQVCALLMLMLPEAYLTVAYVMFAQAISGIAKDLNKMSAKASVKALLTNENDSTLFKWIAILTGSKNVLKGVGFFLGAFLLQNFEFRGALLILAASLFVVLILSIKWLPSGLGKLKNKAKFTQVFSTEAKVNYLSAARFFLFGARDLWFVVALPVYLYSTFEWTFTEVGAFLAIWIIAYGMVQTATPKLLRLRKQQPAKAPNANTVKYWALLLAIFPALIAMGLWLEINPQLVLIIGLVLFGCVFAVNSALHSYLIVAWSAHDKVAMNVGFYYMANAAGRLTGTVLSGYIYQTQGLITCLWCSSAFLFMAYLLSRKLCQFNEI